MINFENSFHELQNEFYANVIPAMPPKPELLVYNKNLAQKLDINLSISRAQFFKILVSR